MPGFSDSSISNSLCGCIACHPFGRIKRKRTVTNFGKPIQEEVSTISSLMAKLKADVYQKRKNASDVVIRFHRRVRMSGRNPLNTDKNFHQQDRNKCGRQYSFNREMKHEKFTPCEINNRKIFNNYSDGYCGTDRENSGGISNYGFYNDRNSNNTTMITAPPRRKKHPRRLLSDSSTDGSLDSIINREIWMNSRNLEFNNNNINNNDYNSNNIGKDLIIPTHHYYYSQNNNNIKNNCNNNNDDKNIDNNNNKNNIQKDHINKNNVKKINNNKSGCSSIEVDSNSVVDVNKRHFMQLARTRMNNDNINNIINNKNNNNNNSNCNIILNREDDVITFCENKIYYKNCEADEYGNCTNGSDVDEVIVCESIINVKTLPHSADDNAGKSTPAVPHDATYTRLYSDSLYKDNKQQDDAASSSSFDSHFDRITHLKSNMNFQFRSPFERLQVKRQTRYEEKHSACQDLNGIIPVHRPLTETNINNNNGSFGCNKTSFPFTTLKRKTHSECN